MRRLLLMVCAGALALAQSPSSPPAAISAYYRLAGNDTGPYPYQWLVVDPPLTLTFDGTSPHLGIQIGQGFIVAGPALSPDTAFITYRMQPPTAAGSCTQQLSSQGAGTGAWAADNSFFYFCVPDGTGQGFIWARTPLQTSW
jgi:hypothetical protein